MNSKIILVTGGTRSGKSSFALKEADSKGGHRIYIATAEAVDEEMAERIRRHQQDRPPEWTTIEEPLRLQDRLKELDNPNTIILIDCITIWLSNIITRQIPIHSAGVTEVVPDSNIQNLVNRYKEELLTTLNRLSEAVVYIVTNEVGMGIVPDNPLARFFRDMAGHLNQALAEIADEVYVLISGIPLKIKG